MKIKIYPLLALLVFAIGAPCALSAADTNSDETAIRKSVADFVAAWNRHDAKALAGTFSDDAHLINPFGRVAKGHAELVKLFTDEHSAVMRTTTFSVGQIEVRLLAPDVAFSEYSAEVSGMLDPAGTAMPALKIRVVVVYQKKNGKWWPTLARPYAFLPTPPAVSAAKGG
jgi:uncharacterized protein (TIGR02246 family)